MEALQGSTVPASCPAPCNAPMLFNPTRLRFNPVHKVLGHVVQNHQIGQQGRRMLACRPQRRGVVSEVAGAAGDVVRFTAVGCLGLQQDSMKAQCEHCSISNVHRRRVPMQPPQHTCRPAIHSICLHSCCLWAIGVLPGGCTSTAVVP